MLKNRLVVTFTTVHGSRQYSLGQVARFLIVAFVLVAALSVFISNPLLVARTDDLQELELNHQRLSQDYELILGSQQLYKEELSGLATSLSGLEFEKNKLEVENLRMGELNANLDRQIVELNTNFENSLVVLEDILGIEPTGELDETAEEIQRLKKRNSDFQASLFGLEEVLGIESTGEMDEERAEMLKFTAYQRLYFLHNIPNGMPIQARRISDRFGTRIHPVTTKRQMHNGIDFKADIGTPVYATADAIAEYAAFHKQSGFGKLIILQHSFGFKTYYAHLDKIVIKPGQFIQKGDLIGYSGNTGISTGPHLHYEVRYNENAVNPINFYYGDLSPAEFREMLQIASQEGQSLD